MRKTILALLLASSATALSLPAAAEIYVNIAPPAPRYEVVPAPRVGYVWVPGFWDWRGNRHVWPRATGSASATACTGIRTAGPRAMDITSSSAAAGTRSASSRTIAAWAIATTTACPTATTVHRTIRIDSKTAASHPS